MLVYGNGTHNARLEIVETTRIGADKVKLTGKRRFDGKSVSVYLTMSELAAACAAAGLIPVPEADYTPMLTEADCKVPDTVNLPVEGQVKLIRITRKGGVEVEFA